MNSLKDFCRGFKFDENELKWNMLNHAGIVTAENAWQKHSTPDSICNQMVNLYKDSFDNQQNILILFNIELIKSIYINYEDVIYKNIYFVADTKEKFNWVIKNFSKINCAYLESQNINKLNECIKGFNVKKFDVVFSNPPYGTVDLQILSSVFAMFDNAIIVHPARWILHHKPENRLIKYQKMFQDSLVSTYLFNGMQVFDKNFDYAWTPLSISYFNKNKKINKISVIDNTRVKCEYSVSKIDDITIYGDANFKYEIEKWMSNILNKFGNIIDNRTNIKTEFPLSINKIIGDGHGKNVWSSINNSDYKYSNDFIHGFSFDKKTMADAYKNCCKEKDNIFYFQNEEERYNFFTFTCTKHFTFFFTRWKLGQHSGPGELRTIPNIPLNKSWNDAECKKLFNTSDELMEFIFKFVPENLKDYKSGF